MSKINLLPKELSPNKNLFKLAEILKNLSFAASAVFVVGTSIVVAIFIYDMFTLTSTQNSLERLKGSIKSLQGAEQKYMLVHDRIDKAKTVMAKGVGITSSIDKLASLLAASGAAKLADGEIDKTGSKFSFNLATSADLVQFLATLVSANLYKQVDLTSFNFSPTAGYSVSLEVKNDN